MKIVRSFYALILILLVFGSIGVPNGFNLNKPKSSLSAPSCLKGGQAGNYHSAYCCGGTYAVELTSSRDGKDFICLSMSEYPLSS